MQRNTLVKGLAVIAMSVALTLGALPAAGGETAAKKPPQMFLVHGYNGKGHTNCANVWGKALNYYEKDGKRPRNSMTTIGYYKGDEKCDTSVAKASKNTSIKDIAAGLAKYLAKHSSKKKPVDIVAHSMGGLVTRVALLGSAKGWKGFPPVFARNVVTLGTPHQGVNHGCKDKCNTQWTQMTKGSNFLRVLQKKENQLAEPWAWDTDWSLVGSDGDDTVKYDSAIDKGHHADQKYRYTTFKNCKSGKKIDHHGIRSTTGKGGFCLRYWHPKHKAHETKNGWSPLKTGFKAATHKGDDLPK